MSVTAALGWGLALIFLAISLWIRRNRRFSRSYRFAPSGRVSQPPARAAMPNASEVLVWVNGDGSARELTVAEKKYVDTEFSPFDGARPYIKSRYEQRNGWGKLNGYLQRKDVPEGVAINPAPSDEPATDYTPQSVANSIIDLIQKGGPD
jgi:hypothetical protein